MNLATEFRKFATSQAIYSAVRITLSIVLPSVVLAHFGVLKEYFLFPLATSFVGLTDQAGPFVRRRNALLIAVALFFIVAVTANLLMNYPLLIYAELIFFGIVLTMIGVFGQRMAAVGGLALVVLAIFIDGHLTGGDVIHSSLVFLAGSFCYFFIFLIVSKIQPYKLAGQMIGENYMALARYLTLKSKFYNRQPDFDELYREVISQQIAIKNLQEETRETVFKTRQIVNESTRTSRLLMLMFLNSIDLHEKLMTSESDYRKIHEQFGDSGFLDQLSTYLQKIAEEMNHIGVALQGARRARPLYDLDEELENIYNQYFNLRNRRLKPENLEYFMTLRLILNRVTSISDDIKTIYKVFDQEQSVQKTGKDRLDYQKFVSPEEKLNWRIFRSNFSLQSAHFRHALRVTTALVVGYFISTFEVLGIGHSYWILITVIAIMRPAFATTKHRNMLRLYGTISGAIVAYAMIYFISNSSVLFSLLLLSMILCFSMLKNKYAWAVFFMTIYIFLAFNFLNPGNLNTIFKDRILDTFIAGGVAYLVSYLVLPVWEHTHNRQFMKRAARSNLAYFESAVRRFTSGVSEEQQYKLTRKAAVIDLANLSDNFQRMISDPKNQQKKMEYLHQFVITAHLITAYIASFAQYARPGKSYPEIDFESWHTKISAELTRTDLLLNELNEDETVKQDAALQPHDSVEKLLQKRKKELQENEFFDRRDPSHMTHLTEVKSLREVLELIFDAAREQRKVTEKIHSGGQ